MQNNIKKIILDTDPGIDDAVAICAGILSNKIQIELITTVNGNVSIEKTTNNALRLVDFLNQKIPVAKGASKPLIRKPKSASNIHGDCGMAGFTFNAVSSKAHNNAIDEMRKVLLNSTEKTTIVCIGPLTNLAILITAFPECIDKIEEVVLMGGSSGRGNDTPASEFNIYCDPEAAKIVMSSNLNLTVCSLDITSKATLDLDTINKLRQCGKVGEMFYSLFNHYRGGSVSKGGLKMHDLTTIAYLVKPELFKCEKVFVDIETEGKYTAGFMVVDFKDLYKGNKNVNFCIDIDVEGFRKWLLKLFQDTII